MLKLDTGKLRVAAVKSFLLSSVMLTLIMAVFFIFAGNFVGLRPWTFFTASFLHYVISTAIQFKLNPELLVHRLKIKRKGSKLWDEILMRAINLTVLLAVPAIAGLDIGRFHWSFLDVQFAALGFVFLIASTILINWAMAVNPHFEPTVRIQTDRGHTVISTGPYRIVRHPGYLGGVFYSLSIPLIIGSAFTFIPVGIYIILLMIRASLEDRTLQEELDGYAGYSRQVRHKLYPGIW